MNTFLVAYDIRDPKRLRSVHRKMKGFGNAVQYSVFKCNLSPTNLQLLLMHLERLIDQSKDRIMVVDLGPTEGRWKNQVTFLGEPFKDEQEQVFIF